MRMGLSLECNFKKKRIRRIHGDLWSNECVPKAFFESFMRSMKMGLFWGAGVVRRSRGRVGCVLLVLNSILKNNSKLGVFTS